MFNRVFIYKRHFIEEEKIPEKVDLDPSLGSEDNPGYDCRDIKENGGI